jgi:hypothetical protein
MNGLAGVGPYISGPNYFGDPFIEKFSGTRDTSFDLFFIWSKLLFFKICCFNYHIISCNFYTKKYINSIESLFITKIWRQSQQRFLFSIKK